MARAVLKANEPLPWPMSNLTPRFLASNTSRLTVPGGVAGVARVFAFGCVVAGAALLARPEAQAAAAEKRPPTRVTASGIPSIRNFETTVGRSKTRKVRPGPVMSDEIVSGQKPSRVAASPTLR